MVITVISVSAPALNQLSEFQDMFREKYTEESLDMHLYYIADEIRSQAVITDNMLKDMQSADMLIVDIMGASSTVAEAVSSVLEKYSGQCLVIGNLCREYLRLGSFSMSGMSMMKSTDSKESHEEHPKQSGKSSAEKMHRIRRMAMMFGTVIPFGMMKDMKNVFLLTDYWQQASKADIESFMYLILRRYFRKKHLPPEKPCTMRYGIYLKDPETEPTFTSLKEYASVHRLNADTKNVAVLFYGHRYPNDFMDVVQALCRRLSEKLNIIPIAFSQNEDSDLDVLESYLFSSEYPISGIISLMPFRLGAGPMGGNAEKAVQILEKVNAPYFKPMCLTKVTEDEWSRSDAVNPGEFLISIMLPELDGGLNTYPVGIMSEADEKYGIRSAKLKPLNQRIDTLCTRLTNMIRLREKDNSEKRIAIVCYNYPPGEDNLFGGAFLDTFSSVSALLSFLKKQGYLTEERSSDELFEAFAGHGICNRPQWGVQSAAYDEYELDGVCCKIFGIRLGNVFIGLQPLRSENGDTQSYHDRNIPPAKEYQAFYYWLQNKFQADAVIHTGTHGTLEFTPGKDNGVTEKCWSDKLIGNIPHFYIYYVGNPSEAVIAKRRTHAVLIGYKAPPMTKSGISGELAELKNTLSEYRESLHSAPERSSMLLERIGELTAKTALPLSIGTGKITESNIDKIDALLYEYENALITDGLHIIDDEELKGLDRVLNGGYLPVALPKENAADPGIFQAGFNLVQFDPTLIPTAAAFAKGKEIAEQTIKKYHEEKGQYPQKTAVILWGLETTRSQGETLGQIMAYLGIRLKNNSRRFSSRFEIIPADELEHPRIDVTIHICGFFRDMFPNLINDLNDMLLKLRQSNESDDINYYSRNSRIYEKELLKRGYEPKAAAEMASCRIFGPKHGEYGTRLTEYVRQGKWKEASELGCCFTEDLSYGYFQSLNGTAAQEVLGYNYQDVELVSQVRNNMEYELIDLDHYYEFYGGLVKAIERSANRKPEMFVADTTGQSVRGMRLEESLLKGIHTKMLNPKWIDGVMRHGYHGVSQIQKRFENIIGFTATTECVSSQVFSELESFYVHDEQRRKQMQKSNQWAYLRILERFMEAKNRGYWNPNQDELSELVHIYLETEGEAEA